MHSPNLCRTPKTGTSTLLRARGDEPTYTIILLMGIWMSLMKYPIKPIKRNPIPTAWVILTNSVGKKGGLIQMTFKGGTKVPRLSGLVQRWRSWVLSLVNLRGTSRTLLK